MKHTSKKAFYKTTLSAAALSLFAAPVVADQVFADDVIMQFSLCVGNDCVNGESFGADTIRMKENNTRVHFDDTSSSASFPSNDWRLVANDSTNGGNSYLAIEDSTAGRIPFRVEAGAPVNALVVEDDGDIGIKTSTPVVDLHIVEGNTPTVRLDQDGSDGFNTQVWDLAGNESNFFIRDVSNSSNLPFKIIPGADDGALVVAANGNIGMGTDNTPDRGLHINRSDGNGSILVQETSSSTATRELLKLSNNGGINITMEDTSIASGANSGREWKMKNSAGNFTVTTFPGGDGELELKLDVDGNLEITGNFISNGSTLSVPDYVFADDYDLRPLAEVRSFIDTNSHLPEVPSAADIAENGINHSQMQMVLLKKVEELTLYTLAQHADMQGMQDEISLLKAELSSVRTVEN